MINHLAFLVKVWDNTRTPSNLSMTLPDLHPMLVHFPIALITLYAVLECLRFRAIAQRVELFYTKAIIIVVGTIGGIVARQFGLLAARAYEGTDAMRIIRIHEFFGNATLIIAGIISILYIGAWIFRSGSNLRHNKFIRLCNRITLTWRVIPLALAALVAVSITGALGGSLVYGETADPLVKFLYKTVVPLF